MGEREDNVYKAKLAEQAERYDGKKMAVLRIHRFFDSLPLNAPNSLAKDCFMAVDSNFGFANYPTCFFSIPPPIKSASLHPEAQSCQNIVTAHKWTLSMSNIAEEVRLV